MLKTKKFLIAVLSLLLLAAAVYYFFRRGSNAYQFVAVSRGSITQTVSVTGNTTPSYNVSLGFGNSGVIGRVYASVGEKVYAGELLATLDTADLDSQLKQAEGTAAAKRAALEGLQAGSRPEDIAVSSAALEKGEQDLANMYAGEADLSSDGYAKANDAVRTELSSFFSGGESSQPSLTYATSNSQAKHDSESGRAEVSRALNDWQNELNSGSVTDIGRDLARLVAVRDLLNNVWKTLNDSSSLTSSALAAYQASIGAAVAEVNIAIKNLNSELANTASQKLTVAELRAALDLKMAGGTPTDIAAAEAEVAAAEASAESIGAKIRNSRIVAPEGGVITQFDAKVGQTASPVNALISIISAGFFEVDAVVPETDIGKVAVGNNVLMTFDAFPNETFTGKIFYIDPAQTNSSGVIGYKVKVAFDKSDSRMKSGLTVNLNVETKKKDNVLILPQYAILETDQGIFVETLENGQVKQISVTLGIQDQDGNVEILSGVSAGQQVLNIGLKKS